MNNPKFKKGDLVAVNPEFTQLVLPQHNFGIVMEYDCPGGCLVWWIATSATHPEYESNLILIAKS